MAASYPDSLASLTNPGASTTQDTSGVEHDVVETKQNEEVVAIETELGTNPKSIDDTVTVSATPSSVANFLDMVARRLKDIIGTSWTTAVSRTLNALNTLFVTEHGTDGTHDATKVAMLAGAQTITGVKTFDATPKTDAIAEKTAAAGVTVDGLLIKDGDIPNQRLNSKMIYGIRDMTAASGNVSYIGVGFTPSAIICFWGVDADKFIGWGVADSGKLVRTLETDSNANNYVVAALVYAQPVANNSQSAVVATFDADGFTLTWTKTGSPTGSCNLIFLCFR